MINDQNEQTYNNATNFNNSSYCTLKRRYCFDHDSHLKKKKHSKKAILILTSRSQDNKIDKKVMFPVTRP